MDNNCTVSDSPVKISKAVSYTFHFKPYGWAIYTINETTGEFHITSDWGSFSHRWDPKNLGERSLACFLAKADDSYVCHKFSGENYLLTQIVDEEETLKAMKTEILKDRRNLVIHSKEDAEILLELAEEWADADFSEVVMPDELWKYSECQVTRDSHTTEVLKTLLLPTFQNYLQEVVIPAEDVNSVESRGSDV